MLVVDGHLAELPGEAGRALALVPGTALTTVYTWQMAHNNSEVGCGQGVRRVSVLTDESCGVPLVAGVSAGSTHTAVLTDGRSEDHLNTTSVVTVQRVSHRQGDRPVPVAQRIALRAGVGGVGGVGGAVVVFGFEDVLLTVVNRNRTNLLLYVLLYVLRSDQRGRWFHRQLHVVLYVSTGGNLLRDGPLWDHFLPHRVPRRVPRCGAVMGRGAVNIMVSVAS